MSEVVQIPRKEWENIRHDLDFMKKMIKTLVQGYRPSKWLTADEVKEMLRIGDSRLKQLRASNQIRLQKFGRTIEYRREDIESYKMGNIRIPSIVKNQDEQAEA